MRQRRLLRQQHLQLTQQEQQQLQEILMLPLKQNRLLFKLLQRPNYKQKQLKRQDKEWKETLRLQCKEIQILLCKKHQRQL